MGPVLIPAADVRGRSSASRSRVVFGIMAGLVAISLVSGCSAAGTAVGASANGLTSLTVAAVPDVNDAPLYIAAEDGQFAAEGLRVKVQDYGSASSEIAALRNGSADVAAGDYADFFYAEDSQPDMLVVAEGYNAVPGVMEVLVAPDSGITTPQQLAGKTIGTPEPQEIPYNANTPYSMETLATQSALQDDGVNPTSVRWRPMPSPDLIGALSSHRVSAILVTEPYIVRAEIQAGAGEVLDSLSGTTANLPLSGYFTSTSYARRHANALTAFRAALQSVQANANTGAPVRSAITRYASMNLQTANLVTIGEYQTSPNASSLQRVVDLLADFGVIAKPLNILSIIFR
jgi:NitT/TauT family transport system substrate-binding protein